MESWLGISVAEILKLPALERMRLVAGHKGLHRIILYVNVIEVPDIVDWVLKGEFLFTTGFPFLGNPKLQNDLIPGLARNGASGLGVKPKRFVDQITPEMITAANEYDFPLLEVPYDLSFSEIIGPITKLISNYQVEELRQREKIHRDLTDLVLRGGTLEEICSAVAKLIHNPVIVVNENYELLASASLREDELKNMKIDHAVLEAGNSMIQPRKNKVIENVLKKSQIKFPVKAGKDLYGYLVTLESDSKISRLDKMTLELASTVVALFISNKRAVIAVERNYLNEFLDSILSGEFQSKIDMLERSQHFGWDLSGYFAVGMLFIEKGDLSINEDQITHLKQRAFSVIKNILINSGYQPIVGSKSGNIVFMVPITYSGNNKVKDQTETFIQNLILELDRQLNRFYFIGIGRAYELEELNRSFQEARTAVSIGKEINSQKKYIFFEELRLYRLLINNSKEQLRDFMEENLGPILQYDKINNSDLLETLKTYFKCEGNMKIIAQELFIHYNTVIYRIQKIEELLNVDLKNLNEQLNIHTALKVINLLENRFVNN